VAARLCAQRWIEMTYAHNDPHLSQFCANHVQRALGDGVTFREVRGRWQKLVFGVLDLKP
jgi:hypothetical protein